MARFGGNEFTDFSVPLVFDGRYFVLEPGDPPQLTVVDSHRGEPVFEVLKNAPGTSPDVTITTNATGVVTVVDNASRRFLYKVRPGSDTTIAFGRLSGGEIEATINDRQLQIGGITLTNNRFIGAQAGAIVHADGSVGIGAPIPPEVLAWFTER